MAPNQQPEEARISRATAGALIVLALLVGFWGGYLYQGQVSSGTAASHASAAPAIENSQNTLPTTQALADHDLRVHLAVLKKDPGNLRALVQAANIHYDAQRYTEAVDYYKRALAIAPNDVNVRTDLGTAYWYQGNAKQAVAEFELALKVQPGYPQTLFNLGIVRLHGLNDAEGAVAAWEKLLAGNPAYPEREKVKAQLEQARSLLKLKSASQ